MPFMACAEHDFQPVNNMPAVYRCSKCGGFAYKPKIRRGVQSGGQGWGTNEMTMYQCHHTGCKDRVVVIWPQTRRGRVHRPSCELHRPDRTKGEPK